MPIAVISEFEPPIPFDLFDKCISTIKEEWDIYHDIYSVSKWSLDFFELNRSQDMVVHLLEIIFHDTETDWIGYYCWETEFGTNDLADSIEFDGKPIPFKTTKDLFNLLCDNMIKNR